MAVEPMKITDEMRNSKQKKIDELVEIVNDRIHYAVEHGRYEACFAINKDNTYYRDVRRMFEEQGYKIKPTGYIGGVWQETEDIYW